MESAQATALPADPPLAIFVARQPIFDASQNVIAYELLYRSSQKNAFDFTDGTAATLNVIRNAFLVLGAQLTASKKAFINFNKTLLEKRVANALTPATTVIEILEDVEADNAVIAMCKELKVAGYSIALDDVDSSCKSRGGLLELADIIKADFRLMTKDERIALVRANRHRCQCLAEKVETIEEFEEAKKAGYVYFQGYFFGKPVILSANSIPGNTINYLNMLSEINQGELNLIRLEDIIKKDTYLSYTLLNYMNSAYFGFRVNVGSIKQALVLLGQKEIIRWASLVILTFIGSDRPSEVSVSSLIRAKFCETIASDVGLLNKASELFMMGMFSMIDVLIGRPMGEILEKMNLSQEMKYALLGLDNVYASILNLILSYEMADWEAVARLSDKLSLDMVNIAQIYQKSVEWADTIFGIHSKKI